MPGGNQRVATDVLVIGAGVAGLAAALEATVAGATVTVADAELTYGGASAISGGGCCIVDSPLQRRRGITDNVELALADWARRAAGEADPAWARRYLERSVADVYDWCEQLGARWLPELRQYAGNSVPRWHKPAGGGGAVLGAIQRRLRAGRVRWCFGAPATELVVVHGGRVTGAVFARAGVATVVTARATVVATGGFVSNPAMLREVGGELGRIGHLLGGSNATSNGTGHRLLSEVGARFRGLDRLWLYPVGVPNYRYPDQQRGVVIRGLRDEIWVNQAGVRFHDEDQRGGLEGSAALLAQPGQRSWGIFDRVEAQRLLVLDDGYFGTTEHTVPGRREEFLRDCPHVWQAPTVTELAVRAGLPAEALQATVRRYNGYLADGLATDPQTGRSLAGARPIDTPPFFAVQYFPLAQKNFGGVCTDLGCRVRSDPDGDGVIAGLYAAGEVAGMAGGNINGVAALEGMMFGPCLFSGRVAGRAAMADLG